MVGREAPQLAALTSYYRPFTEGETRMKPRIAPALSLAWLLFVSHHVQARASAPPSPSPDCSSSSASCTPAERYRDDIAQAQALGARLYRQDQAAWLTTDALRDAGAFAEPLPGQAAGWLTRDRDDGTWVGYFTQIDGVPHVFAEAVLPTDSQQVVGAVRLSTPRAATARERSQLLARDTALAQNALRCTNPPFNTVILDGPGEPAEAIQVFLLSSMTNEEFSLGGYHQFDISADGTQVLKHFAQTRGCVNNDTRELRQLAGLNISHLTSPAPTAFHVFMNLQFQVPLYVYTTSNKVSWKVENGVISQLH